jgi:hypothetical protein
MRRLTLLFLLNSGLGRALGLGFLRHDDDDVRVRPGDDSIDCQQRCA